MTLSFEYQALSLETLEIRHFLDDIYRLSRTQQRLLLSLVRENLHYLRNNKPHYENQTTLGKYADICRQHANTLLKELRDYTFISWWKRDGEQSCMYEIHPYFMNPEIQERLSFYFKIMFFGITSLNSASGADTTQLKLKGYINKLIVSVTTKKRVIKKTQFAPKYRKYAMSTYEPNKFPSKREEPTVKPPSHKQWEPEVRKLEDPFVAAKNFQAIRDDKELMETCRKFGFAAELEACQKNAFNSILEDNLMQLKIQSDNNLPIDKPTPKAVTNQPTLHPVLQKFIKG